MLFFPDSLGFPETIPSLFNSCVSLVKLNGPCFQATFDGCNQLTERSLLVILENCPSLQILGMRATNVRFLPSEKVPKSLSLSLDGCPITAIGSPNGKLTDLTHEG